MKWILIVVWFAGNSQSGVAMQEFDSLQACQWASQQIIKHKARTSAPNMVCVPKGIKGDA